MTIHGVILAPHEKDRDTDNIKDLIWHLFSNNVWHFSEESAIVQVIVKQFTNYQRLHFVKILLKRFLD